MKHGNAAAVSFAAVLSTLVGIAASLAGALPALGQEVLFTEHVISTTADTAYSVFAPDGDVDVLSASVHDDKIGGMRTRLRLEKSPPSPRGAWS